MERGEPTPAIDDRPEIYPDLALYVREFANLSRRRSPGMGGGVEPISGIEISLRADRLGLLGDSREEYIRLIEFLDETFINTSAEMGESRNGAKQSKSRD